ncbi:60S ribosomal protein L28, putative [Hepatocystis sp. ex Piliocolobus tephrosceles]|nr:60S ribosomal protein L28, putative [Hepatocystis sp. ex Piliocolobus tephrosceles]
MSNVSPAIIWELTKHNSCFIRRNQTGKKETFLCDPYNINFKKTPHCSGLVSNNNVDFVFNAGRVYLHAKVEGKCKFTNQKFRVRNKQAAEKLLETHGKKLSTKQKKMLMVKFVRLSKLHNIKPKENN